MLRSVLCSPAVIFAFLLTSTALVLLHSSVGNGTRMAANPSTLHPKDFKKPAAPPVPFDNIPTCSGSPITVDGVNVGFAQVSTTEKEEDFASNVAGVIWGKNVRMATHGTSDLVSSYLLRDGMWEGNNAEMMISLFAKFTEEKTEAVFLDIGSNIGLFGLLAASFGLPTYFFEPFPANANQVCRSLAINKFKHAMLLPIALHSQRGDMFMATDTANYGVSHLVSGGANTVPTKVFPLRDIYPLLNISPAAKVIIKVDVEGTEMDVFEGGKEFLLNPNVVALFLENSMNSPPGFEKRVEWLKDILAHGFELMCCVNCQDLHPNGRCMALDIDSVPAMKAHGVELTLVRKEYAHLISHYDCRGKDHNSCHGKHL